MKLLGRKILVNFPQIEKSPIELTPEVQEQIDKEMMKKWTALEVYAIGDEVTKVNVGDKVYIPASSLQGGERLEVDGEMRLMVGDYDVNIVW